jgi:hypothetical protein
MSNFLLLPEAEKRQYIQKGVLDIGLPPQSIEKDLWVTTILQIVFSLPFADKLVFKVQSNRNRTAKAIKPIPNHERFLFVINRCSMNYPI